jgi:hypothetical protein
LAKKLVHFAPESVSDRAERQVTSFSCLEAMPVKLPTNRVTRLADFSPLGSLLTLGSVFENHKNSKKIFGFLLIEKVMYYVIMTFGVHFWAVFTQNPPVTLPIERKTSSWVVIVCSSFLNTMASMLLNHALRMYT